MLSIALLCERFHGPTGRLELVEADAHPGLVGAALEKPAQTSDGEIRGIFITEIPPCFPERGDEGAP